MNLAEPFEQNVLKLYFYASLPSISFVYSWFSDMAHQTNMMIEVTVVTHFTNIHFVTCWFFYPGLSVMLDVTVILSGAK